MTETKDTEKMKVKVFNIQLAKVNMQADHISPQTLDDLIKNNRLRWTKNRKVR